MVAAPTIAPPPPDLHEATVAALTDSFVLNPLSTWMLPRRGDRARGARALVEAQVQRAVERGALVADPEGRGASLWLRENRGVNRNPLRYVQRVGHLRAASSWDPRPLLRGRRYDRTAEAMLRDRRRELGDHWRLLMLGVDPRWQRRGIGSRLLAGGLRMADEEGLPSLAISNVLRDVDLLGRFAFEVREEHEVTGGGLHLWCLVRPGRPTGEVSPI